MSRTRIEFNAWTGRGNRDIEFPAHAYLTESSIGPSDAVAKSIARKNNLVIAALRPDGLNEGRRQYYATLGTPVSTGGYTPEAEIWFVLHAEKRRPRKKNPTEK